jgi:iron(III) transport system substrate-binding protein
VPLPNQLKIIDPQGQLKIYDLDTTTGITNIGRDPTNDILLKSPAVAPIQLVLDYRQQPYHLTVPGQAEPVIVNEEAVPPGNSCELHDRDVIEIAGYVMTFMACEEEPAAPDVAPEPPPQPEPGLPPPPEATAPPAAPDEPAIPASDRAEPAIITRISEQAWTIDVEQTITLQLTVVNAGDLVAHFNVTAEGVPEEWVTISPTQFHLNEREQATVNVTIIPPRLPTSRAGIHHLTLVVTSPIYPDERSQTSATITINPYYELAVGNLSPKRQSISWSQPSGQTQVPLTNKGNSDVLVRLAGEDEDHASRFEFEVPAETDEPVYLTRQVDVRIPFNKTVPVSVHLIPHSRPLIGRGGRLVDLKPRVHPYTITVTMPQSQQMPWILTGEWENSPRFSHRVLFVAGLGIILALLALTWLIFRPRISDLQASPASIRAGQVVELDWRAWPPFLVSYKLNGKPVTRPVTDRPKQTTTYELRADTWLSHLVPAWSEVTEATVDVRPIKPDILLFEALPERVTPGEKVILSWVVDDADKLVLIDRGADLQETLVSPCGSREIQVGQDPVHYTLRAIAADGSIVEQPVAVEVTSPVIKVFSVRPSVITTTDTETKVKLAWWVTGKSDTQKITLSGSSLVEPLSLTASQGYIVQTVNKTTVFSLSVGSGDTQVVETVRVKVLKLAPAPTPTPTQAPILTPTLAPTPTPDRIVVYTALSPKELEEIGAEKCGAEEFEYCIKEKNTLVVRKSTEDLIRQLLAEKENPRADVIWGVAATGMVRLRAEGLLEPLAGLYQPQGLENIKDGWRDPTPPPQWLGLSAWLAVFCVDENKLPEGVTAPESWEHLRFSDYYDLIAMPNPYTSGTGYMLVSGLLQMHPFGEPAGWAYMDSLHENIRWYTSSGNEPCDLAANNEAIAIGISSSSACFLGNGNKQLSYIYPEEGSGWEMDAVALVRKDVISKDALAFVTWAIDEEAMTRYAKFRPVLSHKKVAPQKTNDQEKCYEGFEPEKQMIPNRLLWASANYERIAKKWLSRYGSEPNLIQLEPPGKP